ncbi:MAG: hypothetical protein J7K08_00270 [Thermoplasmata archaeon]|nr:hypothetical protein [Thermoplasmata archaeon]
MAKLDVLAVMGLVLFLLGVALIIYRIDSIHVQMDNIARTGFALVVVGAILIYLKWKGFKLTA